MIVNKANIEAIFINLKTTFNKAFEAAPSVADRISMEARSTGALNDYSWVARFPKMVKWIGDKTVKALAAFKYTLVNDDYEVTIEVDRNDIEDDNVGIYSVQAQDAGFSAKQLKDEIVGELINGAFENECFDGQYFCDDDHVVAGASVSNKGTAALSCATLALAQASYGAARTAMRKFTDDEGRPLGVRPDVLLVGPALEDTGKALLNNDKLEDGKPNPYKGTADLVVCDWIESDTAWFLLDTKRPIRPFIYQVRKAPVFVSQTDMNADDVFMRRKYKFGAEARVKGGYGFWQLCYGSTGLG